MRTSNDTRFLVPGERYKGTWYQVLSTTYSSTVVPGMTSYLVTLPGTAMQYAAASAAAPGRVWRYQAQGMVPGSITYQLPLLYQVQQYQVQNVQVSDTGTRQGLGTRYHRQLQECDKPLLLLLLCWFYCCDWSSTLHVRVDSHHTMRVYV